MEQATANAHRAALEIVREAQQVDEALRLSDSRAGLSGRWRLRFRNARSDRFGFVAPRVGSDPDEEDRRLALPRHAAFLRKWRLRHRAVADSLEEAGDKLFAFTRLPPSQWKSARTTNAIERLHEEFKRRIKTQTVLPCAETAAMLGRRWRRSKHCSWASGSMVRGAVEK
jgi:hypothetical protein